jgi:CheY-like chemotaxis protein
VLVVDDDETIRELVEWVLGEKGYHVVGAPDGAAALTVLTHVRPDLVLLDLRMPVMDGEAFVDVYRRLPNQSAPIVVMTAGRVDRDLVAVGSAIGRLDKPFEIQDLVAVAERYIGRDVGTRVADSRPPVAFDSAT